MRWPLSRYGYIEPDMSVIEADAEIADGDGDGIADAADNCPGR